ncbi:hypothetical protein TYRP_004882 [Tyrophagus putrescentiae]|nr:hypothetical protein TYRP_004882 [Tyrophagus putrescentiae]
MIRLLKIVLIIRLLVLLEPEACSAVPHDLSNDYSDHYYASKGEEFEALKFEFSEYVQHLKDGDTLKAAGLVTSKRCIAAAKSELNRKKNKCLNPFEMKQFDRPKVHDVALKLPVWFSEEFCHLLHKYQSCLVDTICRHCVNPKVAGEKHLDKKDEICKTERARLFSICTDSVVKQQNCRWWENFKLALWLLAFLFVYFIPSLFRFCH